MTVKEQLQEVRDMQIPIDTKEERLQRLRAKATSTTAALNDMPSGSSEQDKLGKVVCEIAQLTLDIAEEVLIMLQKQRTVIKLIDKLKDTRQREVLTKYYILGYTWEQVAEKMHYSTRRVFEIREAAFVNIESVQ